MVLIGVIAWVIVQSMNTKIIFENEQFNFQAYCPIKYEIKDYLANMSIFSRYFQPKWL